MVGEVKNSQDLLSLDYRVELQKLVDRFATFKKVDQALNRHTSAAEARSAAHASRTHPDCVIQSDLLIGQARKPRLFCYQYSIKINKDFLGWL